MNEIYTIKIDEVENYMKIAIALGKKAAQNGEVPVGAVIVKDGTIIARGVNCVESDNNALLHGEINAINKAMSVLNERTLPDCDIYVTLEPCPMCAGAIKNARIRNVFFGAYDEENGGCMSKWNILPKETGCYGGILMDECENLLKDFFADIRKRI